MLKTFAWCVRVLVFLLLLGLAIKNSGPVTLHFFFNSGWELPVVMVLLAAFGLGALCGATMEAGVRALTPDPAVATRQVEMGLALIGADGQADAPRVGIRGASPDGLPMAGPSGTDGLSLALAPRRNGWRRCRARARR